LVREGVAAAVGERTIAWLRWHGSTLRGVATTPVTLASPSACFVATVSGELLIVCREGTLQRVRIPV
jgi:hypothetical protein